MKLFLDKMIFLKMIFRRLAHMKKSAVTRFHHWPTEFQPLSGDFGQTSWNLAKYSLIPTKLAGIQRQCQSSPDSDLFCQNPTIEYQNLGPLVVDSSYQQTLMPNGGRFSQSCL
jgi:hypothetical protein